MYLYLFIYIKYVRLQLFTYIYIYIFIYIYLQVYIFMRVYLCTMHALIFQASTCPFMFLFVMENCADGPHPFPYLLEPAQSMHLHIESFRDYASENAPNMHACMHARM